MDPNSTLKMLRKAIAKNNVEDATQYANSLASWLYRGGFEPRWKNRESCFQMIRAVECAAIDLCHDEIDVSSFQETVDSYIAKQKLGYELA